jgi:hypothetical protein
VDRLSVDLSQSLTGMQLDENHRTQLGQAINVVLTAPTGGRTLVEHAIGQVQSILLQAGAARVDVRTVSSDLQLIATELVPGLQLSVPVPPQTITIQPATP